MYNLLMPFLDESQSFCLGFEVGSIYTELGMGLDILPRYVHTINLDQFRLVADRYNKELVVGSYDESGTWVEIYFTDKKPKLSLVK